MNEPFVAEDPERFRAAMSRFDEENSRDPNLQLANSAMIPRELLYAQWLSAWVLKLKPDASEPLRLATRGAHLCRWLIPRDDYPSTRAGYLRWRQQLKQFHAQKAGAILRELRYPEAIITRVQGLISKSAFPADPESRVLEDALCLVFLEHQFAELAAKSPPDKMINAVQKTWNKMTPLAQAIARGLTYQPRELSLLQRALSTTTPD